MDTAIADVLRAVDGGALTGALILSLCVLDYISSLRLKYPGRNLNSKNYIAVVDDLLSTQDIRYKGGDVYWLRNALAHTYALADAKPYTKINAYQLTHRQPHFHLNGKGTLLQINVDSFIVDVILTANDFLDNVAGDTAVENRANDLMVVNSVNEVDLTSRSFGSMHHALAALDNPPVDAAALRDAVTRLFPQIHALTTHGNKPGSAAI